jgi:hypothetical protein
MKASSRRTPDTGSGEGKSRWNAALAYRLVLKEALDKEEGSMVREGKSRQADPAAAHPLSELLSCPSGTGMVLTVSAKTVAFDSGQTIFRQASPCEALYLVVQGQLLRRTDRMETRITLGLARPGDLVELAAALGDRRHTYSLVAQTSGLLLHLPIDALHQAFEDYPPLRMRLLEELAREVSRAYNLCGQTWAGRTRRAAARASEA